ncbi:hypothetical protein ACWCQY_13770, partial [Streptomyces sp. NPDC002078]
GTIGVLRVTTTLTTTATAAAVTAAMGTATTGTIGVLRVTTTLTTTATAAAVTATMATATTGTVGVLRVTTTLTTTTTAAAVTATIAAVAVVDAPVTEVTGVTTAFTAYTAEAAVPTGTAEAAMATEITEPTIAETAATEAAVTEPTMAEPTGAQPPVTEATVGTAAEVAEASLGSAEPAVAPGAEVAEAPFGTAADLPTEPAEVRARTRVPVLVKTAEAAEVAEISEMSLTTGRFDGRLVQQRAAEQAVGAGRRHVDTADAPLTRGRIRQLRRVAGGGRPPGVVVAGDVVRRYGMVGRYGVVGRDVVMHQRMRRTSEEQGRLGQPWVESGRSPVGAGLDAEGAEFGDLRGRQAESSRHLVGVAVEFGTEGRVDGQAGQGSTICVVGHGSVSVSQRALMPIATEPRIPPGRRQLPFPAIPADTCRTRYRGLTRAKQEQPSRAVDWCRAPSRVAYSPIGYGHRPTGMSTKYRTAGACPCQPLPPGGSDRPAPR